MDLTCLIAQIPYELWTVIDSYIIPRSVTELDPVVTIVERSGEMIAAGFCLDKKGNLYYPDENLLHICSPTGQKSQLECTFDPICHQFNDCFGASFDATGNLFVVQKTDNSVKKITPSGHVSMYAGRVTPGFIDGFRTEAQFHEPCDLCIDDQNNIWVCDTGRIRTISPKGIVTTIAGDSILKRSRVDGFGSDARFHYPTGICFFGGYLYIAENLAIRKMSPDGAVSTLVTNVVCDSVRPDHQGNLLLTDIGREELTMITPEGKILWTRPLEDSPNGCQVDYDGNVYILGFHGSIVKIPVERSSLISQTFARLIQEDP